MSSETVKSGYAGPTSKERFKVYAIKFVNAFEKKLETYSKLGLDEDSLKPSDTVRKMAPLVSKVIPIDFVGVLAATGMTTISEMSRKKFAVIASEPFNGMGKETLRHLLVNTAGTIYQSFEMPFAYATDDRGNCWRGTEILAIDAARRIFKYIVQSDSRQAAKINENYLTRAVISANGTSKKEIHLCGKSISTSEFYENVGIIFLRGKKVECYSPKGKQVPKMAYRLRFTWEQEKTQHVLESGMKECLYQFELDEDKLGLLMADALNTINQNDSNLMLKKAIGFIENKVPINTTGNGMLFNFKSSVREFTGRDVELGKLQQVFEESERPGEGPFRAQVIFGLGGVGKTELAKRYVMEHRNEYSNIFWIHAETKSTLNRSFERLAMHLALPLPEESSRDKDIELTVDRIYKRLVKTKNLFVFDNAICYQKVRQYLPENEYSIIRQQQHVLLTSRCKEWEESKLTQFMTLELKQFSPAESRAYIIQEIFTFRPQMVHNVDFKDIDKLGETLQYLPLALSVAISFIRERRYKLSKVSKAGDFNIASYLELYNKDVQQMLSKSTAFLDPLFSTWCLTVNQIRSEPNGKNATDVLNIMAFCSSVKIPTEEFFPDEEEALCLLDKYSMIDLQYGYADIHPLVQTAIRVSLKDEKRTAAILEVTLRDVLPRVLTIENQPHVLSVVGHAMCDEELLNVYIDRLNQTAVDLRHNLLCAGLYDLSNSRVKTGKNRPWKRICDVIATLFLSRSNDGGVSLDSNEILDMVRRHLDLNVVDNSVINRFENHIQRIKCFFPY